MIPRTAAIPFGLVAIGKPDLQIWLYLEGNSDFVYYVHVLGFGDVDLKSLGIPTLDEYITMYSERMGVNVRHNWEFYMAFVCFRYASICRATTRPPRPSSTAECLRLIARLREEQASAASWEPRPPFEAAEMD